MIEKEAEKALREAGGDWQKANKLFHDRIEAEEELRRGLLDKGIDQELRDAAKRLGETTRSCPYCAEVIVVDAVKCRFCGEWLSEPGSSSSLPEAPPADPSSAPIIRHFTLLTGWVLIVLMVILIVSFAR